MCPHCAHHILQSWLERQITNICPLLVGHTASQGIVPSFWKAAFGLPHHTSTQSGSRDKLRTWVDPKSGYRQPQEIGTRKAVTLLLSMQIPVTPYSLLGMTGGPKSTLTLTLGPEECHCYAPSCRQYAPLVPKASSPQWEAWPHYQLNSGGCGIIYSSNPCDSSLRKKNEPCQVWDSPEKWLCLVHMTLNLSLPPFGD